MNELTMAAVLMVVAVLLASIALDKIIARIVSMLMKAKWVLVGLLVILAVGAMWWAGVIL